ncbi:MAG: RagB/SusD family nutrient uptake outer membrane protein, partial [Cytophagales bacterium]|nr:RagB/SusD family nutrient uptake outer membrane protein [Cytophagales bacterium]
MNKHLNSIKRVSLGLLTALVAVTGCNDDFVNTKPLTEVPQAEVWKDGGLAEAFVTDLYVGLGNGGFDEQMLASLTDEAIFTHPGRNINTITEARSNAASPGWINGPISWFSLYARNRAANLAIENLTKPQFTDEALAKRLLGEATFMRAYQNHQLLRYYGAFPIVERSYQLGEADYLVSRNTFEECVNAIVKDADAAAQLLDGTTVAAGRASKAAALALKSRVLLYAASDLHHIPTASTKSAIIAAYPNPELIGYTGGDRTERWTKARDAAK